MPNGGIESHILSYCDKMSQQHNMSIDIIVPNFQMGEVELTRLKESCDRVILHKGKLGGLNSLCWLTLQSLKLVITNYDAIYTNGQGESIEFLSKVIFRKKKWVHHHHTSGDEKDQASWSKGYKRALNKADVVIACSTKNAKDMTFYLQRKIDTIPCFSSKILQKPAVKHSGKIKMGYYGRLIPEKGIDILCKMSEDVDFKDTEIHIWGQGEAYPPSYFLNYPNIKIHNPFKGEKELTNVVHSIDVFLLISRHPEGLPICLLEAMGAGLPWIATNKGGISDIISDPYATRLINNDASYKDIKDIILDFISDFKAGKVQPYSQVKLYKEQFSSFAVGKKWEEILSS